MTASPGRGGTNLLQAAEKLARFSFVTGHDFYRLRGKTRHLQLRNQGMTFSRAAKAFENNTSLLPQACAQLRAFGAERLKRIFFASCQSEA
jgi:hypothetical protein